MSTEAGAGEATVVLPRRLALDARVGANKLRQLEVAAAHHVVRISPALHAGRVPVLQLESEAAGRILICPRRITPPTGVAGVILSDGTEADPLSYLEYQDSWRWLAPKPPRPQDARNLPQVCESVIASWEGAFTFREASHSSAGLRTPQLGALHALVGYWTARDDVATIVMPTGTGKTDTMIAALVRERLTPLLVAVPSRALRTQLADKFLSLGLLKDVGCISSSADYPVVGVIDRRIANAAEARELLGSCNVLVATMQALTHAVPEVQATLAEEASHLFIDEAHHIGARTWAEFRQLFADRPVVQFTATPYRGDGRHVSGRSIYEYPLRLAQAAGYFRPISFHPVYEFDPGAADERIAQAALGILDEDVGSGRDHLLMARCKSITRAEQVHALYQSLGRTDAVLVHSQQTQSEQQEAFDAMNNRRSRIIICVDMFGEGFDLPELKVAALHDHHRGLAITLQFIGRFTRTTPDLGDASVVANITDPRVESAIADLYAQDSDWNGLLSEISEGALGRHARRAEFLDGFGESADELPLQTIYPKMSTVVYEVDAARWHPERIGEAFDESKLFAEPAINLRSNVAVVIAFDDENVPWGNVRWLRNTTWHLYLIHYNEDQRLLFIHSSDNRGVHKELAEAVAGAGVSLVGGDRVFRVLGGIQRLVVANLGLKAALNRAVRFTMYAGPDVRQGISDAQLQNRVASNLFGFGYEAGSRASVGCSQKGRIWSYRVAEDISEWTRWCAEIGDKLADN